VTARLVLENMKHQPMRSLLSALLIGVPVTLILALVGLSHGMLEDAAERTRGVGADVIVRPKGSSLLSLRGGIPQKFVDYFLKQPHVKAAVGVLMQPAEGVTMMITGLDLPKYTAALGGFKYVYGGPLRKPGDILIDEYYARQKNARVGSRIKVLNREWQVAGIIQSGQLAHLVVDLRVLQEMMSATDQDQVNSIFLKLDNPASTGEVIHALKADPNLEDWPILSTEELASAWTVDSLPGLSAFIYVVMGIGVVIGFFVVCLSMYMAVLQRTREIGILKSLGASKSFILRIILVEAFLLGVGGTVVGIVLSFGANYLIGALVPASIQMKIVPIWWPIAGGITLVGAILGALGPGLSAAASDPIEALAYE
jgi:putative ABC transport system permease protein